MTTFAYGLGTLGRDMLAAMVSLYLMFYVTEVLGIGGVQLAVITGVIVFMRVFDAVNDPVMGWIVDNTRTRWGKFKPWMSSGAILWAGTGVVMFSSWDVDGWTLVLVFTLSYLAYEIAYTINDISYWGMLPALSRSQRERDRIGALARICANLGLFAVVVGIVPGTAWLTELTGSQQSAWTWAAVFAAGTMLVFQMLPILFAREHVAVETGRTSFRELVSAIVRNDQLLWVVLGMTLFMTGYTTTAALGLYYFVYVLDDEAAYPVFAAILGVTQVVALALFPLVSRFVRRFRIHLGATILVCAGYLVFLVLGDSMAGIAAAGLLLFAGQAAVQLLMVLFIADSVEYGQWRLGRRNESITFALQPFVYKLSSGLSTGIVGVALLVAGIGDDPGASGPATEGSTGAETSASPEVTEWALKTAMLVVPLVLAAASYLVIRAKYRLDEQTYSRIVADLRARESPMSPEGTA